eukprot:INCI16887.1.p1 GENE.INCI16887.1~~INCI16887.1.p1  ORF type:complete len:142 (+),score=14.15 INCI16887.1:225-650(+)
MTSRALRKVAFLEAEVFRRHLRESGRRVIGVDVGSYRVGFSIAENIDGVALPLKVVKRDRLATDEVSAFITDVVQSSNVGGMVVGWPLEVNGSEGVSCRRVTRFMKQVSREVDFALPYTYYDESNTTVNAYEDLKDAYGEE